MSIIDDCSKWKQRKKNKQTYDVNNERRKLFILLDNTEV